VLGAPLYCTLECKPTNAVSQGQVGNHGLELWVREHVHRLDVWITRTLVYRIWISDADAHGEGGRSPRGPGCNAWAASRVASSKRRTVAQLSATLDVVPLFPCFFFGLLISTVLITWFVKDKEEVKNSIVAFRAYEEANKTVQLTMRCTGSPGSAACSRFPVGVSVALDTVTRPSLSR
jgi:hypothetical protein